LDPKPESQTIGKKIISLTLEGHPMTTQEAFIARVKGALKYPFQRAGKHNKSLNSTGWDITEGILSRIQGRTSTERLELLNRLINQGKPLNLHVIPTRDTSTTAASIAALIKERSPEWEGPKSVVAWPHPLIDALSMDLMLTDNQEVIFTTIPNNGTSVTDENWSNRRRLEKAFVGITSADYCLSETATLVIKTRRTQARAVSLLPTIHVAVIELEQVIANLAELFALLKNRGSSPSYGLGNCLTMITGPSKTADIELTMVHGAHGPRELYLFVIAPEAV
jgi:L-lactate dehydrogenase complex protein LldG